MALDIDLSELALGSFDSRTRLHRLEGDGPLGELLLETWCSRESLNDAGDIHITALSENPRLDLREMLSRRVTIHTLLSDGTEFSRSGIVTDAVSQGADGGLAQYALVVRPWLALLQYTRRSQVWQDKSVVDIVESLFSNYAEHAAWRWADDIAQHLQASANAGVRSVTTQYRESDFAFLQRIPAEEGIVYRFEHDDAAPMGCRLGDYAAGTALAMQAFVQSANSHVDWAAAKRIALCTAGGASIVIEGGNVTVQCPGDDHRACGQEDLLAGGEGGLRDAGDASRGHLMFEGPSPIRRRMDQRVAARRRTRRASQ